MIKDNQFLQPPINACDPKIRGTSICFKDGKCSECGFAEKYVSEHPEI